MTHRLRALVTLVALLVPVAAAAQSYTLSPVGRQVFLDNNGNPCNACKLYTYTARTLNAASTYADISGTTNQNPVVMNSAGRPSNGGNEVAIYLAIGTSYKFILKTSAGAPIWSQDDIAAVPPSAVNLDIPGVAGESLTAGDAVYLSDGSGSKNAGQWYKADADFTYASTLPEIGMVPTAIGSGATGSIRIMGSVTGLSSLSTSSEYFISATAGALTTTVPANRRHVGHADSTTTLVLTGNPAPPVVTSALANDFRLSLTTATCVTTADVTAATTLYWTPCTGNRISLFDSSGTVETCTATEKSIAIPATTSQMYDVWAYDSTFGSCTVTLELLAWTNDTTRATALARTNGAYAKTGDSTRLYLGSVRTTTVSGQTEDSFAKRYVWNHYNRRARGMRVIDTTNSWNYSIAAFQQARAAPANQLDFVIGVAESSVEAVVIGSASTNVVNGGFMVSIGEDSTTVADAGALVGPQSGFNAGTAMVTMAQLRKYPAVGRHVWVWLEKTDASGTFVWYGDNGGTGTQSGINGTIWN